MTRGLKFLLCLAPQFLLVAGLVAREEVAIRTGAEIELEVGAVDPMSLFSGRYVSTPLRITTLDPKTVRIPPAVDSESEVYVRLVKQDRIWTAAEVSLEPPEGDVVFLQGRWDGENRVDYGLDQFYIPDDGEDPSRLSNWAGTPGRLHVKARVTHSGHAVITDLMVDGQSYREWNAAEKQAKKR